MAVDPIKNTGDGTSAALNFTKQFFAEQLSTTTLRLVPNPDGMTETPDYYRWTWQKLLATYIPDGTSDTGTRDSGTRDTGARYKETRDT